MLIKPTVPGKTGVKSGERVDSSGTPLDLKSQSVISLIEIDDNNKGREKKWRFSHKCCVDDDYSRSG